MKKYTAEAIDVYFEPKKCIHAAECVQGLGEVFDTTKRPWVDPSQASTDQIAEVIERCPSGALTYDRKDGGANETHEETAITVGSDGEFYVKGEFTLDDGTDQVKLNRAVLTGSDETDNPPFYDKSLKSR